MAAGEYEPINLAVWIPLLLSCAHNCSVGVGNGRGDLYEVSSLTLDGNPRHVEYRQRHHALDI